MDTDKIYQELKQLQQKGGSLLFKRLQLADQLLSNEQWVNSPQGGSGNLSLALRRLELECFGDICGAMTLTQMVTIYQQFPEEETWEEKGYNLRELHTLCKPPARSKKEREEAQEEQQLTPWAQVKILKAEIRLLKARIARLERENDRLRKSFQGRRA